MKAAEEAAFARGVSAEDLMERAGEGLADLVSLFHPTPGTCLVYFGKGHNGGDALVAARFLAQRGWQIRLHPAASEASWSPLTLKKSQQLGRPGRRAQMDRPIVILDGLLGLGSKGPPRGEIAHLIAEINQQRAQGAWVLAIDLPSGLDGDTGDAVGCCVTADLTATIAFAKKGLIADAAVNHVGRLALVPLPDLHPEPSDLWEINTSARLAENWPIRAFDTHKGMCGRVGIVAGSRGFLGAARLCSEAAVRAGAGLVTLFAREEIADLLMTTCCPEVMVKPVTSYTEVLTSKLDVLAIGPGLGRERDREVLTVIRDAPFPVVVDADALNALATDPALLRKAAGLRLLTPHPGEMERLFPQEGRSRREWATNFVTKYPCRLLLKGARTIVTDPEGKGWYNTTGDPGMGSGGMGDTLTGVLAALIGQQGGEHASEMLTLAAWLCARAGEAAADAQLGCSESLCAADVIAHLPTAFRDLRRGIR